MADENTSELQFEAPGPGVWLRDEDHWPRPVPASYAEIYPDATVPFVKEWTARYGLLLDYFETAFVNGFGYARIHAVGEPGKGGSGPPPKPIFQLLLRLHPALRERRRAAESALERRLWLKDLERWDRQTKPKIMAENRANAAVPRSELGDSELLEHVHGCRESLRRLIGLHHRFNGAIVCSGLLMVKLDEWVGDHGSALSLLEGASPVSSGRSPELERLASVVRFDSQSSDLLDDHPAAVLERLHEAGGEVGEAYRDYLETVGYRLVGDSIDHGNPTLVEVPELMLRAIRNAVENEEDRGSGDEEMRSREADVRNRVPRQHREEFDRLLSDARETFRMRDERSVYGDVWAAGIFRQSLLELGRRLAGRGLLEEPRHLVEATSAEVSALASAEDGSLGAELSRRARFRSQHANYEAPPALGGEPADPPPPEWLPPGLREVNEAVFVQISGFLERGRSDAGSRITGTAASFGSHRGTAKVIVGPDHFHRIEQGDVMVTRTTSEAFNVVLPLLGAMVTDRGGPLSHAAIVSREAKIPCVVGTGEATKRIPDGAEVVVNGSEGFVDIR